MHQPHLEYVKFTPDVEAYRKEIHYEVLEDEALEGADYVLSYAADNLKPSFGGILLPVEDFSLNGDVGRATIGGKTLEGPPVAKLKDRYKAAPYFATCGMQLDGLDADSIDFMASFWIDTLKKQALIQARRAAMDYFRRVLGSKTISSINPGSGNVGYWDVSNLKPLFELFYEYKCISDVTLNQNMYMIPNKSVCGILFPSETELYTCSVCNRENCPGRRAPFKS
jgi:hypothetical protein